MSDERLNSELEQMGGNPRLARAIKDALNKLSKGAGGAALAEMARDVLDGRTDLRTVGQSAAYSEQMTRAIGQFQQWQADLTPEEREHFIAEARARLLNEDPKVDQRAPSYYDDGPADTILTTIPIDTA
jgi:hypothetical protein